jgi:hypothetical protein
VKLSYVFIPLSNDRRVCAGLLPWINLAKEEQTALEISVSAIIPDSSRFFPRRGTEMQASGTSLAIITLSVSVRDAWA